MLFMRSILDNLWARQKQQARLGSLDWEWDHDQAQRREPLKLSSRPRTLCDSLITVHCTDVRGGFGVAPKHKDRFEAALLDRYAGVPYHAIASRRLGAVRNQSLLRRTSHGNGGNRGAGFAVDCAHDESLSPELASASFRALILLVSEVHDLTGDRVTIVPHRVFSASRRLDPGPAVWRIVQDVVSSCSYCDIDYELREAGGRPIPRSWDSRALYDDRGQLIR